MGEDFPTVKRQATIAKGNLTRILNRFNTDVLTPEFKLQLSRQSMEVFNQIKVYQEKLQLLCEDAQMETLADEIVEYQITTLQKINSVTAELQQAEVPTSEQNATNGNSAGYLKQPEIKLPRFSDNSHSIFEYNNFKNAFTDAMNSFENMTDKVKFVYLKSNLSGKSLQLIENLPASETSYSQAFQILDREFLDISSIFNHTMQTFISSTAATNVDESCEKILKLQCLLVDLEKIGYNIREEKCAVEIVSLILRSKLPKFFLIEACRKLETHMPSALQLFDSYKEIAMLLRGSQRNKLVNEVQPAAKPVDRSANHKAGNPVKPLATAKQNSSCKFCSASDHVSSRCKKYASYEQRLARTKALNICSRCLSAKHNSTSCSGAENKLPYACANCKKCNHVTPMCSKSVNTLQ